MTDGEKTFTFLLLLLCAYLSDLAYANAREAHRHTHELACHVGATELCSYYEGESHD